MKIIKSAILKTLAYYDCFDWPLTAFEIWKYLAKVANGKWQMANGGVALGDIVRTLDEPETRPYIAEKNGFYFLKDREKDSLAEKRVEAEKMADMKWKILRRRAKWMALVPYIRLVMASGSIAMGRVAAHSPRGRVGEPRLINMRREEASDFDTFVIAKAGRIWTTRFLLTIFFDILGWRRRGKITKNKFCLNHYLTDEGLSLESRNISTAMGYYGRLVPVLGDLDLFQKFQGANQWLGEYLENYPKFSEVRPSTLEKVLGRTSAQRYIRPPGAFLVFGRLLEFLLNPFWSGWMEKTLGAVQLAKIKRNPLTHGSPGQIIASDKELRFHPGPQERDILEKYRQRLTQLGA